MKLYLGIDGGQSSTTAVIGDETGRVLGSGRGGPCNHVKGPEGRPKFINAITGCVRTACEQASVDFASVEFETACAGFSGGSADKEVLLNEILRVNRMTVTNDAIIALYGATAGAPGIITIAGTGSISYGRNADGKLARAGGWGYIFGDEGGGFDLTRQALRAILRFEEGWGPHSSLFEKLLAATGAPNANDLLHRFYTTDYPRPAVAAFSKFVDEAANEGDLVARNILFNAAQQLASQTSAVRANVFAASDTAVVCYIGGVFKSGMLLERFKMLVELEEGNHVRPPRYGPATGGLIEAYRIAGLTVDLSAVPEFEK